jgi:hypothetical protein
MRGEERGEEVASEEGEERMGGGVRKAGEWEVEAATTNMLWWGRREGRRVAIASQ